MGEYRKMVYGRILFNNIREYTPLWFQTIPYARTHQRPLVQQAYRGPAFLPKNRRALQFFARHIQKNTAAYSLWIFFMAFTMTDLYWEPLLFLYKSNNSHRGLDHAYAIEKAYKASRPSEDDEEEEEEEEE